MAVNDDCLFFWAPEDSAGCKKGSGVLSQWYERPFVGPHGDVYPTAEHWMMAGKAFIFGDQHIEERIMQAKHPSTVKALGQKVKNFRQDLWDKLKYNLVVRGNFEKFSQHEDLKKYLLDTGSLDLVEASPYDDIWGIGMNAHEAYVTDRSHWRGQNLLGKALEQVREMLRVESYFDSHVEYREATGLI